MNEDQERDGSPGDNLTALAEFVERMISVAQRAGMSSIQLKTANLKLKINSGHAVDENNSGTPMALPAAEETAAVQLPPEPVGYTITAPMVGTFYHSTSPSDPPLVKKTLSSPSGASPASRAARRMDGSFEKFQKDA